MKLLVFSTPTRVIGDPGPYRCDGCGQGLTRGETVVAVGTRVERTRWWHELCAKMLGLQELAARR